MDPLSLEQTTEWNRFKSNWNNVVRPKAVRTIAIAELAAKIQLLFDNFGQTELVFNDDNLTSIKQLVGVYNRLTSSQVKVDMNTYGLRFAEGDIDIMAPMSMPSEEYQDDVIEGYSGGGLLIGALIVAGIWGVTKIFEGHCNMLEGMFKARILEIIAKKPEMAEPIRKALDDLFETNKETVEKAGLLDHVFGGGTGSMIGIAIAAGVLLFAFARGRKK